MKALTLSLVLLALRMAVANPLPVVIYNEISTIYTTVTFWPRQSTEDFPQTSTTLPSSSVVTPLTSVDEKSTPTSFPSVQTSVPPSPTTEESSTAESTTPVTPTSTSTAVPNENYGHGTFFYTGTGACGITNDDTQYIAALPWKLFDKFTPGGNPNHNTLCGKKIIVSHKGRSVVAEVVDRCEGCEKGDVDLSLAAFQELAPLEDGRINISWRWQ